MNYYLEIDADHVRDIGADEQALITAGVKSRLESYGFTNAKVVFKTRSTDPAPIYQRDGRVEFGPNETHQVSSVQDAAFFRLRVPLGQLIIGGISWDIARAVDGHPEAIVQVMGFRDERYRRDLFDKHGAFAISVFNPDYRDPRFGEATTEDMKMRRALVITHDAIWPLLPVMPPGTPCPT